MSVGNIYWCSLEAQSELITNTNANWQWQLVYRTSTGSTLERRGLRPCKTVMKSRNGAKHSITYSHNFGRWRYIECDANLRQIQINTDSRLTVVRIVGIKPESRINAETNKRKQILPNVKYDV